MGKSCTGKVAIGCTIIAFTFILVAFTTPHWLQSDGHVTNQDFKKIGLWQVCFERFQDPRHLHDTEFNGCSWVFQERLYPVQDVVLLDFFVATQFFFTLCTALLLIGSFLTILYTCCSCQHKKYHLLLWAIGSNLTLAAMSGIIAVLIFGARGDYRDWMIHWEQNDVGWSYALAVIGSLVLLIAGILFLVEARRFKKKLEQY